MRLSLYTSVKDGLYFDYHVVEMLKHHLPLAGGQADGDVGERGECDHPTPIEGGHRRGGVPRGLTPSGW